MAIQTLWDTGSSYPISPGIDGGVYGTGIADCVCKGIGDEFTLQYSSDSLTIQFNAGSQCIIGGAFFKVMSLEAITLAANATIYLCANVNKSNANGQTGSFVQRTSSNMQSQNLNGAGTSRDLLLYVITTSGNGVSNVSDRRYIRGDGGSAMGGLSLDVTNQRFSATNSGNQTMSFSVTDQSLSATNGSNQTVTLNVTNQMLSATNSSNQRMSYSVQSDANGKYFAASNAAGNQVGVWAGVGSGYRNGTVTDGSGTVTFEVRDKEVRMYDSSNHRLYFKVLTQAQYNSASKDSNMLYFVTES